MDAVRLVHLSDIHVTAPAFRWFAEDWFNKRLPAWFNLRLPGPRPSLPARRDGPHRPDGRVRTPAARPRCLFRRRDRTRLRGRDGPHQPLLGLTQSDCLPGLAVPGNHDYCAAGGGRPVRASLRSLADRHRVSADTYPFAQRVGPVWLVGVCSATPNRWPWDASGGVGKDQLARLGELLRRLEGGPRVLVTHYPVCLASGRPERGTHCLRDLHDLAEVARAGGIGLWLHGHRHDAYEHPRTEWTPFPVICAGSSTQNQRWSYGDYTLTGHQLQGVRRTFDLTTGQFRDATTFALDLPE